jgi:hypothetical protein
MNRKKTNLAITVILLMLPLISQPILAYAYTINYSYSCITP